MSLAKGAVWLADLSPTQGREQSGLRPVVILSPRVFNEGRSSLVIVCPMTTKERGIRSHIRMEPPAGGLRKTSFIMVEAIRSISKERLVDSWGVLSRQSLEPVEDVLRILLDL